MANEDHVAILKQGVDAWNQWREKDPDIIPDLSGVDLTNEDLGAMGLMDAAPNPPSSNVMTFHKPFNLAKANLSEAKLIRASLRGANLLGANLAGTNLATADMTGANLERADLNRANLIGTILNGVRLAGATIGAAIAWTPFGDVDLRTAKGLETAAHFGPSTIGIDSIYRSKGNIPDVFLRGCGVLETMITFAKSLAGKAIEFNSAFISFSSKDAGFAKRLHADLRARGVRVWFAPEDLQIGDKIRPSIDEAIRLHDKLMLVLSEHSIASQWIEQEVETALERERREERIVLFPIRLDDAVMQIQAGWAAYIRNTRHIGDFTQWKSHDDYQNALDRLFRDLKAETEPASM